MMLVGVSGILVSIVRSKSIDFRFIMYGTAVGRKAEGRWTQRSVEAREPRAEQFPQATVVFRLFIRVPPQEIT